MGHSRRLLVCLALSGCLGTDTDHAQPIDTGVLGSAKVPASLVNRVGDLVLSDTTTVPAPELCAACTVTAEPQTERVIIYDDRDGSVLGVIASKSLPAM